MLSTLRNAWRIPELRRRILFTIGMLLVFRIGAHIPVPGINRAALATLFEQGNLLGFFDVVSGGALKNFTIFAMTVSPYITASIIIQLLTVVIPKWEALAQEGPEGRRKLQQYTRYATVVLGFIQAFAVTLGIRVYLLNPGWPSYLLVALTLTAGTAFLMWLGEQITDKGIGNGISLIIFAGIISRVPLGIYSLVVSARTGVLSVFGLIIITLLAVFLIAAVIFIQQGERRIPVQYAKRVVGRKIYGGQSTHIPMKLNQAGVIPVIFASSILLFPVTISQFSNSGTLQRIADMFRWGSTLHAVLYVLLVFVFTYFYTTIQFNPRDIANNLKQYGGFIPGIRPGKPTSDYLSRILWRLTFVGAAFLSVMVLIPILLTNAFKVQLGIGGTALLIVVGVALDTMKQIEAQLLMRHYSGFLK